MNHYVTGTVIKELREMQGLTQAELARKIKISDKAISKWETMRGLPDITLIAPLSKALGVSVMELLAGEYVINKNVASNMLRSKIHVCPICGNVIHTMGEAVISCCGITLPEALAEKSEKEHDIIVERVEDEYLVLIEHDMTKEHYISFFAYATTDSFKLIKLYPEGTAQTRFLIRDRGMLYAYCNRHGLVKKQV